MLIKLVISTLLIFAVWGPIDGKVFDYQPQQIHLAFGGSYSFQDGSQAHQNDNFRVTLKQIMSVKLL